MHKRKNMRNFLSSERHKCLLLDDRVVKKVSKTNFGGITNKAICWGISAMLGISSMVGIWGAPHAPKSDAAAIRGAEPNEKTQAVWRAYPKPPISPMVCIWENAQAPGCIWGVPHAPNVRRCRYSGCRTHIRDASYLGSQPQAPRVFMGSAPCPQG